MGGSWGRLVKEEGFLVVVVMIGNVGNFIFHIYMSRTLGSDGYGALTALLSLLYVLSIPTMTIQASLAQFISARAAVEDVPGARAVYRSGVRRVVLLAVVIGSGVFLAAGPVQAYLHLEDVRLLWLLAGLVALTVIQPACLAGLQGLRRFQALGVTLLLSLGIKCGVGIGLVALGGDVASAMSALVVATGVAIAAAAVLVRPAWAGAPPAHTAPDFLPVFVYTVPVAIGFLALTPFANFDIVLVRHYLPTMDAGYYASAMILGKAFLFLPVGIVLALFPNVAHAVARREDPRMFLWPALGLGAALSLAGAVVCFLVPGLLARLLIRSAEPEIVPLLRWVGFAMTPAGLSTILLQYHMARKHWTSLPGILAVAVGFVLAVVRWHASPAHVLSLVAVGSACSFLVLLVTVWWPAAGTSADDADSGEDVRADAGA